MALDILRQVEYEKYDEEKLNTWIKNKFEALKSSTNYNELPYIMLLVKIDNIIGYTGNEHMELLAKYYDLSLDYLKADYDENKSFDIFFMNDVLETSILLDRSASFLDETVYMINYYSSLQDDNDGCFGADKQSLSNILPTFCTAVYYNLAGIKMPKQEKLVETIRSCQTIEGYFLPIMERASDLESAYYTYKIFALINSKCDYEDKIKRFLRNQKISDIRQEQSELLFYYRLNDEIYGKNELCDVSRDLISKLKETLRENDLSNYYLASQAIYSLETLNLFDEHIDNETYEKLVKQIEERNGVVNGDYLFACYDLLILKLLGYNNADGVIERKSEIIKGTLFNDYREIEQDLRLFYLYWGIQSLNSWGIEFIELADKGAIVEDVLEHKRSAVFSLGTEDYPSLSSTYYYLYIMQNIKNKQSK